MSYVDEAKGSIMNRLLGSEVGANPYMAAAGALGAAAGSTATSASNGNKFEKAVDNSRIVNFGSGSVSKSDQREAASQWIGIAAGIVTLLVAFKMLKG